MTKSKVQIASERVKALDTETQNLLSDVRSKNSKALRWFAASWTILFILAVGGLYYQNKLATQSKSHIDCIIKDLSTPQAPGTTHKYIDYQTRLSADCKIKFN